MPNLSFLYEAEIRLTIRLNARIEGHAVIANGRFTGQYLHECPASVSIYFRLP